MTPRYLADCPVAANDEVAPGQYRMRLHAPAIARAAAPGQFCMMEVAPGFYPFLRRPMCFEQILGEDVTILYKVEGEGTRLLSRFAPGQSINVQGPLGKGFPLDASYSRHILAGGGIGAATFPGLAKALTETCGYPPEVVLAARSKHLLLGEPEFRALGCAVHIATDDGSAGERAYASELVKRLKPGPDTRVYACGPMMMMQTVSEVALAAGADCLVSLEAHMACGDGACLGCVVASKHELEGEKMVRVCVDGPVFDTNVIDWEAHNRAYNA